MENLKLFVKKLSVLFVDLRLITYVAVFLASAGVAPEILEQTTELETVVIDLIAAAGTFVTATAGLVALLGSWGVRPPSGLKHQELLREVLKVIDKDKK